jgi:flagellar hook-associated protein 3 FlgL
MIYGQNMKRLSTLQAQLMKTQQHISANTRLLTPADDPVAAARALDLKQGQSMNTQFASNRGMAGDALKLQERTLNSFVSRIQDVQTLMVYAGNGIHNHEQLKVLATELRSLRDEMVGYANSRDAFGDYVFSGLQVGTEPFQQSATGVVTYKGDTGQRMVQVDNARYIPATDSGANIFMGIKGTTASTVEASRNDFMMDLKIRDIDDPALLNNHVYEIRFTGTTPAAQAELYKSRGNVPWPPGTIDPDTGAYPTVDVIRVAWPPGTIDPVTKLDVGGTTAPINYTGRPHESLVVVMDGIEMSISGQAVAGDYAKFAPGEPVRNDVFAFLNDAIDLLENINLNSNGGTTNLMLGIGSLLGNFASTLDKVVTAQGTAGTRLRELEALDFHGMDKDLLYTESISDLVDLDYYKVLSELMQQMVTLEAAQKTFVQTTNLSLFNLL